MSCAAVKKLNEAQQRTGSLLSIGLEPVFEYLPQEFDRSLAGLEKFLEGIIDGTRGLCSAYKFNLAFFEVHGVEGVRLLYRIREKIPADTLLIADAKRGDIGSTAKQYAKSLYETLAADSATVNPLMGFDSAEPFLSYADKLTYFLVATSNPGAADFLLKNKLYLDVGRAVAQWNTRGNCGFVVGATRAEQFSELRDIAPTVPFLVPGIGAQGGDLESTLRLGASSGPHTNLLLHVTRGILPVKHSTKDFVEAVREKTIEWNLLINTARGSTA